MDGTIDDLARCICTLFLDVLQYLGTVYTMTVA
jgi:hypothetical protein